MKRKIPPDVPFEGERTKMRGREGAGTVLRIDHRHWTDVKWDDGVKNPRIVHRFELQSIYEVPHGSALPAAHSGDEHPGPMACPCDQGRS